MRARVTSAASVDAAVGPAEGFGHLDRARSVDVETPEHVRLGFELAGLGSRAAAVVVDVALLSTVSSAIVVTLLGVGAISGASVIASVTATAGVLLVFAIQWGYFFVSEGFFGGRTLGKRWLGLRVIGAGGTPVTLQAAALRNLVRIVDLQPIGSSVVGLGFIALHPRAQRLGDIVAGTVVVRDRGTHQIPEQRAAELPAERSLLDPQRFEILEGYLERRDSLPGEVRKRLAGTVARAMGPVLARHPRLRSETLDQLLEELYEQERPLQSYAVGTSPQAVRLVREQRDAWDRCRVLVDRAGRRGLSALTQEEVEEFTTLYREVVADLARAHTYGGSLRLCFHLERLAAEAHNLFYRRRRAPASTLDWMRGGFPRAVRGRAGHVGVAAALLFTPSIITWMGVRADPGLGRRLVPVEIVVRAEEAGARLRAGEQYIDVPPVQMSLFSSRVMTNNLQVAFTAAAGGMLAGVVTVLILVYNGTHLGSVFGLYDVHGAASLLWVFVASHGVLELTAIAVAGGAGLLLAHAIVAPGRRTRGRALREVGRECLSLVGGAAMLLVLAGLVEGFVSPARVPIPLKLGFAATIAALLVVYLAGAGRAGVRASPST